MHFQGSWSLALRLDSLFAALQNKAERSFDHRDESEQLNRISPIKTYDRNCPRQAKQRIMCKDVWAVLACSTERASARARVGCQSDVAQQPIHSSEGPDQASKIHCCCSRRADSNAHDNWQLLLRAKWPIQRRRTLRPMVIFFNRVLLSFIVTVP